MPATSTVRHIALGGIVATLLVATPACGDDGAAPDAAADTGPDTAADTGPDTGPEQAAADPTTSSDVSAPSATTTAPATDAPTAMADVNVYWGWTVLDPPTGSPERIGAGVRHVAAVDEPVFAALEALLGGTDAVEDEIGMVTSVPAGTRVLGVTEDGSTTIVDLSAEFEQPSGSLEETMRLAQVVFTATQFDGVDRVRFRIDGEPRDVILSHGFVVGDGMGRDDLAEVRAPIMIERPYPGAEVADPLVISGESNTFEATVRYAITEDGGDGRVVAEGFGTATAGNGTWGTFEIVVELPALDGGGPGSIVMWEEDPRDGAQVGVVEIPIVLIGS